MPDNAGYMYAAYAFAAALYAFYAASLVWRTRRMRERHRWEGDGDRR